MPWAAAVGAIGGALISSRSARSAADTQAGATRDSIAEQQRQADRTYGDQAPYRAAGIGALGQYQSELNKPTTAADVMSDPGYQFGVDQGQQALDRRFAAAGGRMSGASLKAASRFNTGAAASGYNAAYQRGQDRLNRLQSLAGLGQTSTQASAQAGASSSNAISNLISSQGNAAGAAQLAQGNIWGNTANQIGALYGRYSNNSSGGNPAIWAPGYDGSAGGWTGQH